MKSHKVLFYITVGRANLNTLKTNSSLPSFRRQGVVVGVGVHGGGWGYMVVGVGVGSCLSVYY